MRIDVKKFLFVGNNANRNAFFARAQREGVIEFIDASKSTSREVPQELHDIGEAIKVLRTQPVVEQEERPDFSQTEAITGEVLSLARRGEKLREERRVLRQEIARVDVFGDFSPAKVQWIEKETGRHVQFFAAKKQAEVEAREAPEVIFVGADHGLDYFFSLNREPRGYEGMIEMKIDRPLGVLQRRMKEVNEQIQQIEEQLKVLAKENNFLHEALIDRYNGYHLQKAKGSVDLVMGDALFAVQGWVAKNRVEQAQSLAEEMSVHFSEVAIEESDHIPTYLENSGLARIGEDLVHIYDTPSTGDKDPSTWVLWSFALFFAIILGDGGYGALFLMGSAFLWYKFPKATGMLRRVMKLSTILSVSCILWGIATNSFFGLSFDLDSTVRSFSGLQWLVEQKANYHLAVQDGVFQEWLTKFPGIATVSGGYEMLAAAVTERGESLRWEMLDKFSDAIMLELALVIGVVHVSLSLLRSIRESWAGIGWIFFMVGGYLYVPEYLNCTSMAQFLGGLDKSVGAEVGLQLVYAGLAGAVVLALVQHKAGGLGEIINVIQVFSDVLSYLRLYALGLAGAMMSSTFNEIGSSAPFIAGFFIILIGHIVNIVLSIMGGVIHGLRLNFLEWYHYCFEGGGKMFRPLELAKVKETN